MGISAICAFGSSSRDIAQSGRPTARRRKYSEPPGKATTRRGTAQLSPGASRLCSLTQFLSPSESATRQKCPVDQGPNGRKTRCTADTLDVMSYQEPLSTVLAVLGIVIRHQYTPIVPANHSQLSYLPLSSLALCFLYPFMFIGYPDHSDNGSFPCHKARHRDQGVGRADAPWHLPNVCFLLQTALCILWVTRWPPQPINSTEPGSTVTLKCNGGSLELFYAMLGYLGLLGLLSLLVAFPAHRLPDTFNEAKHITVSMLVCSVSGCPSYLPTKQRHRGRGGLCHLGIRSRPPVLSLRSQVLHHPSPPCQEHQRTNAWQTSSQVRKAEGDHRKSCFLGNALLTPYQGEHSFL
ncbi:hypothetical protein GHT09_012091 [Marmota monax]|uniref:G-protein coupled receptors family 3 profile domain-containing protein n=1 Tax=Marmota monax TaxID=9995 RepID=A0A834QEI4_MARMO|nr:hypothetical protein GHT09_012091 [Marmota monax]